MTEGERRVIESLRGVYANKGLGAPDFKTSTVLDDSLGLDSLDFAELVVRLESEFGKDPFSTDEVPAIRTIADLAALYAR